ncbi:Cytochrome P450 85A [Apostasia shenzhenica]|uniref:Cytochrome P450 85A1 n=1 Tax=Apostasia shenzhenica TaxID=1088818 RepID=A0A2I0A493_9ASPA|nr:Cytochrome P450 85A [Apostasia shenzhenica]
MQCVTQRGQRTGRKRGGGGWKMVGFLLLLLLGLAFVLLFICTGLLKWNELRYRKKGLPPGTMGWPVFGETTEFMKQGPSFMKNRRARYGFLFKSHILGCPTVVCMDPELNSNMLMNEGKGLVPGYPQSMLNIMGKWNIAAVSGSLHKAIRSSMLGLISPTVIRSQHLSKIDENMRYFLCDWNGKLIDIQEKTKEMWLLLALKLIAGIETGTLSEALKSEIYKLLKGTISLPFNFPGTNYHNGLQARKKIITILQSIIKERRREDCCRTRGDMLDSLLGLDVDDEAKLSDEQIVDTIITLVYSGFETVSTTTMMSVKYLHDHPKVLEELREEHFEIRRNKSSEDKIDWNDYKSMKFTRAVICETLRLATVVNGVLRKTTQDIELKGFVVPKGWKIYVYTREMNYDPFMYPEPLSFSPWRWMNKNLESNQFFLAFGGGGRLCPGKELGIAEISMFLHYFVTRYRWEEVGGEKLLKFPRVEAPNGLHIRVSDY